MHRKWKDLPSTKRMHAAARLLEAESQAAKVGTTPSAAFDVDVMERSRKVDAEIDEILARTQRLIDRRA